jgi:glycine oxidase
MKLSNNTHDIIVVGGGIIGLSIAWRLASEGRLVTLVERNQIGSGTSWSGAGILPPANLSQSTDPLDQLRGLSHELFPVWAADIQSETGKDIGLRRCGGWYLAESPGEMAAMVGLADYWSQLNIEVEQVPLNNLKNAEPSLTSWSESPRALGAWWAPDEYQVRPPHLLKAMQEACQNKGVVIEENANVCDAREIHSKPQIKINGEWQACEQLVLSGGAWLSQFTHRQGLGQSIIPVRGQILLLQTSIPICTRVINVGNRYLVCREDGHILVGSCEEEVGYQNGTSDEIINELYQFACFLIPQLEHSKQVHRWSGLRPMTFDGFPMIGRIPSTVNIYVACGHYRSGLHLSTGTASIMTDMLQGRQPKIDMDAFRIGKQIL